MKKLAAHFFSIAFISLLAGCAGHASHGISDAEIRDVVARVAHHQIHALADGNYSAATNLAQATSAKAPEGIAWNYPWGVTLYALQRAAELNGDTNLDAFVTRHNLICARYFGWLAGVEKQFGAEGTNFARSTPLQGLMNLGTLDSCGAMGNEMLENMMRHPDKITPEEKIVVARVADWVVHRQSRLPDGTLWRPARNDVEKTMQDGTLWPDDLYMGGVFLVRQGIYKRDRKFIDDAGQQIIHQAALEQDSDGFWFHGYFMNEKKHAPFKWGRGNGWATVALVETLSAMPKNDSLRPQLLEILRRQIDALKKAQAPDGMWRQILDDTNSWDETSCTGMFAYGIARAVNRGWIDSSNMEIARHAFASIAKNVTPDGAVNGTSQGTSISTQLDYYLNRERPDDDPHGIGPVILAGMEILSEK